MTGEDLWKWRKHMPTGYVPERNYKYNGWTQEDLACALNVSVSTVSKWEQDLNKIPPYLIYALNWIKQEEK